jgi:hypothetical protein
MTTLSIDGAEPASIPGLAAKILRYGGVVGLIAVIAVCVLAWIVLSGQKDLAAAQQDTLSAVQQHESGNQADRKVERQLQYAQCLMLAKLSRSDAALCEVGR